MISENVNIGFFTPLSPAPVNQLTQGNPSFCQLTAALIRPPIAMYLISIHNILRVEWTEAII